MSTPKTVEFEGVSRFFEPGTDVSVKIKKADWSNEKRSDWVGIFPVGWKSLKEFVTFVYVKLSRSVTFRSASLPFSFSDSFYQFVYVSADCLVLATSIPFQFQVPYDDVSGLTDSDEMVIIQRKPDMEVDDFISETPRQWTESESTEGQLMDQLSDPIESAGCMGRGTASAPPSGSFSKESPGLLKRERDKYMRQFRLERKVTEMQEEKYLELQTKYNAIYAEKQTLRDENDALRHENRQVKEELRAAHRDNVLLDTETKRLGGLVADLSRQNRHQSQEALAHQAAAQHVGEREGAFRVIDSDIHVARPPPYHPPSASITDQLGSLSLSGYHVTQRAEQSVAVSVGEDLFECPMCNKKLPRSLGNTSFQMHVNQHFQ